MSRQKSKDLKFRIWLNNNNNYYYYFYYTIDETIRRVQIFFLFSTHFHNVFWASVGWTLLNVVVLFKIKCQSYMRPSVCSLQLLCTYCKWHQSRCHSQDALWHLIALISFHQVFDCLSIWALQEKNCTLRIVSRKENNITLLVWSCHFWIIEEPLLEIRTDKHADLN